MAGLDLDRARAILKEYYDDQTVTELMYQGSVLFAMLNKVEDFEGKDYPLPNRISNPQGNSATFGAAKSSKRSSTFSAFHLTRVQDYSLATISTETMLATQSNAGAFIKATSAEIEGAFQSLGRRSAWKVYGSGNGSMGRVTMAVNGTTPNAVLTITCVDPDDIAKIELGQTVEVRQSGGAVRTFTGPAVTNRVVVNTVDRSAGTFTAIGTDGEEVTAVSGTANTDMVVTYGDWNACASGLAAWVPVVAPGSTPFFGVDRSQDSERLGGIRIQSTGKPQDEAIIDAARRLGRAGARPDHLFTGWQKYAELEKLLGAKVRYSDIEVAGLTFKAIEVPGPNGTIKVVADRDCPNNVQYMLTLDDWAAYSLGKIGRLLDQDGNRMLREADADAVEVRVAAYYQIGTTRPGHSGVLIY